jgi:antitoxin HicB
MQRYPARLHPDPGGGFTVTFRDIPEAITQGDTLDEAQVAAVDALTTAMNFYFEDGRPVPQPSATLAGEVLVVVPPSIATKVALLNLMLAEKVRPADLARAMNAKPQEVNRLLNLHHATKIDTIAAAFEALGRRLDFRVLKA